VSIHNACGLCHIEMKDITVKKGKDILLNGVNTILHCGELTALIGKNGAGKTTLLRSLLGEYAYEGKITFHKHDNGEMKRPQIGYVPQQLIFDHSMPVSVLDFMMAAKGKRPVWLGHGKKERIAVEKRLADLECGAIIDRRLGELSGGELQKMLLAMAIDPMPDLLILDEPVSGVDALGLELFYKTVCRIRDEYHLAILLVSHDLGLIRKYADRVVLLDKCVLSEGEVEEVFQGEAFRKAFGFFDWEEVEK